MHSLYRNKVEYLGTKQRFISLPGLLFVLAIHGALFYGLWQQRLIPPPDEMVTLFVDFIAAPMPKATQETKPEPAPAKLQPIKKPLPKPEQPRLVSKAPVVPKEETIAPEPEPEPDLEPEIDMIPEPEVPIRTPQMQTGPVTLTSELAVSCPELNAPAYPPISRRMGEEGQLVLKVELNEDGRVDNAEVINSSGYARLDDAAMTAVKSWKCKPPLRDGQPARAIALQPFNFVLQGN